MKGRGYHGSGYRYGFNGKEVDPEDGYQDYGMRMYNPKLSSPVAGVSPDTASMQH